MHKKSPKTFKEIMELPPRESIEALAIWMNEAVDKENLAIPKRNSNPPTNQ